MAVLGEMPRRSPISSLEQPSAINSTTSRWRAVIAGIALFRVSYMMVATLQGVDRAPLLTERRIFVRYATLGVLAPRTKLAS